MELWDLYTRDREKTGRTMMRGDKVPEGFYRLVVHICIFNEEGDMLIQQRQSFKRGWPGLWDLTVGGHVIAGETSRMAAEREIAEELGIQISLADKQPSLTVSFENGFDDMYTLERNVNLAELTLQEEEVQAVQWAAPDQVLRMIDEGTFIPYHKGLVEFLFYQRNHCGVHMRQG
ncbi:MAG: NUDIX domain-containing protein [Muribaculaceae bacterium]|nr:NUDIX domain-containing protein [Roseburia sp.]MCM1432196.1 NUDIX domain-containing protein [Muribaculaceae bacterium]MCM1493937.1 NUDIX domain-containing protein [Muribaculaceae bacterium]